MDLLPIGSASGSTRGTPKIATQVRSLSRERLPLDGPVKNRLAAGSGGWGDQKIDFHLASIAANHPFCVAYHLGRKESELLSLILGLLLVKTKGEE